MKRYNFAVVLAVLVVILLCNPLYATAKKKAKTTKTAVSAPKSEVYVFPVETEKQPYKPARRVITGIFSQKQQKKAEPAKEESQLERKARGPKKYSDKTIAWTSAVSLFYHDPKNRCIMASDTTWIEDMREIVGLDPCPDCFIKRDAIPTFIEKESGMLDLSTAGNRMNHEQFTSWAKTNLEISKIDFISSKKVLVYPKAELGDKGLYQLAKEVQRAYLRHAWKVIEVNAKNQPDEVGYISSFADDAKKYGVVEKKEDASKPATQAAESQTK